MKNAVTLETLHTHTHTHTQIDRLQENSEKSKRIKYIDVARGIAIILMIIGHVVKGLPRDVIFSFHMPLFIIISGMFYKEKNYKETIKNIFLKLILPYVICTLVIGLLKCDNIQSLGQCIKGWIKQIAFSYIFWGKIKFAPNTEYLGVLWFFPLLALIRLIFKFLKTISKDDSIKLLFLVALISYIGYMLGIKQYWLPFSLDVAMFGIIFYYIGYILQKTKMLDKILSDNKVIIIIFIIWILSIKFNWVDLGRRVYSNGVFSILTSVCGTISILKISQLIEKYLKHLCNILVWYGKNSMFILLMHYTETNLVQYDNILSQENKYIYQFQLSSLKVLIATTGTLIINGLKKIIYYIKNKLYTQKQEA